jgi:nucleoside-diphosphate-sugar epimerase
MGDVLHSRADISKAKKILGYSPKVAIKDGLIKTVDWYKNNDK